MNRLLLPLSSLLSGVGLLVVGVGLLFSVVGLRGGMADFSGVVLGLVMSAYFVGFVFGTFVCPIIIRRVGHIRAFAAMASLASTMPILHALWVDPWFWGALRFITGICLVGLYIVVESWLNTVAPTQHRGRVFAVYMSVNFVALALGQWLILVGDTLGFVPFVLVSIMFSFALLPITLTPVDEPEPVEAPRLSLRYLYQTSPLGVAGAVGSGLINGAFYGMGAVFAQGVGFSEAGVAAFMAATILGGAIFQWPVGHYSDRHDRRHVLLWVMVLSAVLAVLAFVLARHAEWVVIAIGLLFGGLVFTVYGLSVAHVNDLVDSSRVLEVTGGLLLVHGIGAALGPTLAGIFMDVLQPESLMLYFALVLTLLSLYAVKRIRAAAPVPEAEKFDFVMMGTGSQAVLQLDPRTPVADAKTEEPGAEAPPADLNRP
ncbi:MFS transporter [Tepidicella baoligensis]|uniref:MFS transporter n=1 Tax=Tepidicella baoligensis TaxID=2707016 RepID=UPI0015DA02F3|nr:MFS transporter [Tepidicella baoligensis]